MPIDESNDARRELDETELGEPPRAPQVEDKDSRIGQGVSHYRIESRLGAGGSTEDNEEKAENQTHGFTFTRERGAETVIKPDGSRKFLCSMASAISTCCDVAMLIMNWLNL